MRRVLVDINVVLDVLLDRRPHAATGGVVRAAIETGAVEGVLAAHAVTTPHCLIRKELGAARTRGAVAAMLSVFEVAPVDGRVLKQALELACPDYEDAVTAAAAVTAGCDTIVTRDVGGFRGAPVRVGTPEEAAARLRQG